VGRRCRQHAGLGAPPAVALVSEQKIPEGGRIGSGGRAGRLDVNVVKAVTVDLMGPAKPRLLWIEAISNGIFWSRRAAFGESHGHVKT